MEGESGKEKPQFDIEAVLPLLKSQKQEENLAGLLLLAKHPLGPSHVGAHEAVRPFLLRLLKQDSPTGRAYQELAVSVLAHSLPLIPWPSKEYVLEATPFLVGMFLREGLSAEAVENVAACLVSALQTTTDEKFQKVPWEALLKQSVSLLSLRSDAELLLHCVGIAQLAVEQENLVLERRAAESLIQSCVSLFCTNQQHEIKLDSASLLLQLLALPKVRQDFKEKIRDLCPALCKALYELLRSRNERLLWISIQMAARLILVLDKVDWMTPEFLLLLLGRIGVEVSMAFDKGQVAQDPCSVMIMACCEAMEGIMRGLAQAEQDVMPVTALLQVREKLNDICRVPMGFLLAPEEEFPRQPEDLRPQIATRLVATWTFLDPEAVKAKEVSLLMPLIVKGPSFSLFLQALAEYWLDDSSLLQAFVEAKGLERVEALLLDNVVSAARKLHAEGDNVQMELRENMFWVDPADEIVGACGVLAKCLVSRPTAVEKRIELLKALTEAAALLYSARTQQKSDDNGVSTVLAFVISGLAHVACSLKEPVQDDKLRAKVATALASYVPIALLTEGLSIVRAVTASINGGDLFGIAELLEAIQLPAQLDDKEQKETVRDLQNAMRQRKKK